MKLRVKIIKPLQSYNVGDVVRLSPHFAHKVIARGQAVQVENKQEKAVYETKEEKHAPTEDKNAAKDYTDVPLSKLDVSKLTDDELLLIIKKDIRKTAVRLAQEEIKKR